MTFFPESSFSSAKMKLLSVISAKNLMRSNRLVSTKSMVTFLAELNLGGRWRPSFSFELVLLVSVLLPLEEALLEVALLEEALLEEDEPSPVEAGVSVLALGARVGKGSAGPGLAVGPRGAG